MMMKKIAQLIRDRSFQINEGLKVKLNLSNVFYLKFWTLDKSWVFKYKGYEGDQKEKPGKPFSLQEKLS